MNKLKIITSTTRPGHKGTAIGEWFTELVKKQNLFEVEFLDIAVINLPLMDEPHHPRMQNYQHQHTKDWSKKINEGDAYVIILAEYNFGIPAPIKNAIDFLFNEWKYKPMAFVSYGGTSGGMRSLQMIKQIVTAINVMPISESLNLAMFTKYMNDKNEFAPDEKIIESAQAMVKELARWADSMKVLRDQSHSKK